MSPTQAYINPAYQGQVSSNQGGGPNLLDLVSNAKSISNTGSSSGTGIMGNVTSAVNNFGQGLGFATTAPAATYTGVAGSLPWQAAGSLAPASVTGAGATLPWLPGGVNAAGTMTQGTGVLGSGLGTSATLSGTLGAAGLGALAGNFLGKIGGNSTSGSIGGGVGAAVGFAVGGPIGGVIGGAIGGIGGGFFGNKSKPTQADEYRGNLREDGSYSHNAQTGKNPGQYAGFGKGSTDQLSAMFQKASKDLGIKFNKDIVFGGGISTRHGGSHLTYGLGSENIHTFYDYNDPDSSNEARKKALLFAAGKSGADLDKVSKWYDDTISGKTADGSTQYNVPFKSKENFDAFMTKFKSQETVNASPTNTASTPATN
jgi:hypothetical protein